MNRRFVVRQLTGVVPVVLLLLCCGRLVVSPTSLLVDADRPTIDRARVVDSQPGNDLTRQFWTLHLAIARSMSLTGHLPEWDDRGFGGRPLVGNPQAGLFYPPVWLAWLIPAPAVLGWITLGHLIWGGWGVQRLTRMIGLSPSAGMVAAGCFLLNPYVIAQTYEGHYPHVWAASWYPWAFAALIGISRGSKTAGLGMAVCLAAVVLAGHPQEGYYLVLILASWASLDLIRHASQRGFRAGLMPITAIWAGTAALTLGLVAVEVIPAALVQGWTLRSARLPVNLASRYHPLLINAWQIVNPLALAGPADYFGPDNYWETVLGIGLIPALLALVGATWTRDRTRVRAWIILAVGAVWFASGRKLGLFSVMYEWVPGIDRFRVSSRSLFLASLACAVLAGAGVDALARDDRPSGWARLGRRWLVGLVVLLGAIGWGHARAVRLGLSPRSFGASGLVEEARARARSATDADRSALALDRIARQGPFWLAVVGVSAGLAVGLVQPHRRRTIAVGLGVLGMVELAATGFAILVVSPPSAWLKVGPAGAAILRALPSHNPATEPPPLVRADDAVLSDLQAVSLGLSKTDINDAFQIQHAADLYQQLYELSRPRPATLTRPMDGPAAEHRRQVQQTIMDRMGVVVAAGTDRSPRLRVLVEDHHWPIEADLAAGVAGPDRVFVARNPTALPHAYLVAADPDAKRAVTWRSARPGQLALTVTNEQPSQLVVATTWMPGWSALVDGRPGVIERDNHAQIGVELPRSGRHEVTLTYRAPGFWLGKVVTLGAVSVGLGGFMIGWVRRWRSKPVT